MAKGSQTATKRAPSNRVKPTPLTEKDWVNAATDILVQENVRGIRIDALCKKLGVTKGSFYWHFASRAELLQAMLTTWRRRMTLNTIQNLSGGTDQRQPRLFQLLNLPRRPKAPQFAQVEQAIRDWGRRAPQANEAVTEVDRIRFEYFTQIFKDMGFSREDARRRAYLAYAIMMGDSVLQHTIDDIDAPSVMEDAVALLGQLPDGETGAH